MKHLGKIGILFVIAFALLMLGARSARAQAHTVLTYHGGPVMNNVQIYPLFYGAGWTQQEITDRQNNLAAIAAYINQVNVPGGLQSNKPTIRQYGVVSAALHPSVQAGQTVQPFVMSDAAIQSAIHASQPSALPAYAPNVLIYVFLAPGFEESKSTGQGSCSSYHSFESDTAFYAVVPECGGLAVIQHEVAEAATDPSCGGWWGAACGGGPNDEQQDGCTQGGTYIYNGTSIGIGGADNTQGGTCSTTGYYAISYVGRGDIVLTGPASWNTIPVAFNTSNNGSFVTTNQYNVLLSSYAAAGDLESLAATSTVMGLPI